MGLFYIGPTGERLDRCRKPIFGTYLRTSCRLIPVRSIPVPHRYRRCKYFLNFLFGFESPHLPQLCAVPKATPSASVSVSFKRSSQHFSTLLFNVRFEQTESGLAQGIFRGNKGIVLDTERVSALSQMSSVAIKRIPIQIIENLSPPR